MKLDFEIAVDQQTKAHAMTKLFRGFWTPGAHRCLRDSHALIWSIIGSILPNHLYMLKIVLWGALLVATSLLNTYTKSDKNWPSYEQNTICPYLVIRNKYYRFWPNYEFFLKSLLQETTGIPGAVNSRRRGRVYPHSRPRPRPNMVIPADNSRPHPRPRRRGRCSVHGPGPGHGQILPPVVYCLTQNSTRKLKVEIQFYVDYENFMKKY